MPFKAGSPAALLRIAWPAWASACLQRFHRLGSAAAGDLPADPFDRYLCRHFAGLVPANTI